jgi:hypothetical protein
MLQTIESPGQPPPTAAADLIRGFLFKVKILKIDSLMQWIRESCRLNHRMKKLLLVATVLLGTVAVSRAGIDIHVSLPFPPLPHVVFAPPAPVVVAHAPPVVYAPAPVCAPAPIVYAPAPICVAPRPVIVRQPVYGYPHRHGRHGHRGWAYSAGHYHHR